MSVESMALVLHHSRAKGTAKLVLLGIANHSGDGGAWPSVRTLARYANVHERNVQRAIEQLVQLGELAVHRQQGGTLTSHRHDFDRPNRYDVLVSCPALCDRTAQHRVRDYPQPTLEGGVANTPPGGDSATRGGDASATQTVHSTQPTQDPASTTDRARRAPVDNDRPPVPANPPADELAKVRDRLRAASDETRKRERGGAS